MTTPSVPVPAAMPGEEEIARAIFASHAFQPVSGPWVDGSNRAAQQHARDAARAILDLFGPILAEKDEHIAALQAMVSDSLYSKRQALEARALAAEAALAGERERMQRIIDLHAEWRLCMPKDWEGDPLSDAIDAAASRAQGTSE